jgi:subtilisin family serine protease
MKIALDYAAAARDAALRRQGHVVAALSGRHGVSRDRVAATTNNDVRSSYSSYGPNLVSFAAPGDWVITPYPFGSFAATSGTSFSAPIVSGAAALLVGIQGNASPSQVSSALSHAKYLGPDLGKGRIKLVDAVAAGRAMWPWGASSAVPDSCGAGDVDWTEAP